VHCFLNKFASKWCQRFPPHLNNVFSLSWKLEMLIAHMLPSSCYGKKLQNLSHLNSSKFARFESSWCMYADACGKCCKRRCTKHASLLWSYQRRHWRMAAAVTTKPIFRHNCPTLFSVAVSVCPGQWHVFCTPSLAIVLTHCNQLDSYMANLEATVEVGWILEFLSVTTQR